MSYYTWCDNVKVRLGNHETYSSKEDVEEQIVENNKGIEEIKQQIFGVCSGNIKDLLVCKDLEGNEIEPLEALRSKMYKWFEDEYCGLKRLISHNVDLRYIADNWDKHKEG